jgi:enamine deaminase RidA (YjgF/YER057c/UK114 family)
VSIRSSSILFNRIEFSGNKIYYFWKSLLPTVSILIKKSRLLKNLYVSSGFKPINSYMSYEKKFNALKDLPPPPTVPKGANFIQWRKSGKLLTLSGYGPLNGAILPSEYQGKLGGERTVQQGYDASRLTAINLLMIVQSAIGSLDNVDYILNVEGYVNCTDDFTEHPSVINGCSDLLVEIFGNQGKHTRSAVGANSLAFGISVEIGISLMIK